MELVTVGLNDSGKIRPWLASPGNIITLVLAIVTLSSAIFNAVASRDSQLVETRLLARTNAEQIQALNAKLDRTVELMNKHVQWSEGRSQNVEDLTRRVERLEKITDSKP